MKKLVVGMLAHVDAGKTTLSENILYHTGIIKSQGNVDHKDTFLDFYQLERERGITIFSKMSHFLYKDTDITLIDTPGHVDFSGEMERSLSIIDVAVLIINGNDGVQSHTKTIWSLLKQYHIPTLVFVNKMDISQYSKEELMDSLHQLSDMICDYHDDDTIAMCDDSILEEYMTYGSIQNKEKLMLDRQFFPVLFGSALKDENTVELLNLLHTLTIIRSTNQKFESIIYKITHVDTRVTHMKVISGELHVKDMIDDEKIHSIRRYQGDTYESITTACPGDIIGVTGLTSFHSGETSHHQQIHQSLIPGMHYEMMIDSVCDRHQFYTQLKDLGEEEPLLHLNISNEHIDVSLMGDIQKDILIHIIDERYHVQVHLDAGQVIYKETILYPIEGVGHYEPLRHYAEVHILLEPLERGQGIQYENRCMNDLPLHFQRLIMTHLKEISHPGVLTGSALTDIRYVLLGGRSHQKHTVGGDFREATYRAVQHALMRTKSLLLEPYYHYTIEVPVDMMSTIFYDFDPYSTPTVVSQDSTVVLQGKAPVSFLNTYMSTFMSHTKGMGSIHYYDLSYEEVIDDSIIENIGYSPDNELFPAGSVFCKGGAGFYVDYLDVENYMHLPMFTETRETETTVHRQYHISDEELESVMIRTYGKQETKLHSDYVNVEKLRESNTVTMKPLYMIVDGYNLIHAHEELKEIASHNLGNARDHLIDLLKSYQGLMNCHMMVVFDAYKVSHIGEEYTENNFTIVYTRENELADHYIESITKSLVKDYRVTVVTSDALEQTIILGHGATRMSSREFINEMNLRYKESFDSYKSNSPIDRNTPIELKK